MIEYDAQTYGRTGENIFRITRAKLFGNKYHIAIINSDPNYCIEVSTLKRKFMGDFPISGLCLSELEMFTLIGDREKIDEILKRAKKINDQDNERNEETMFDEPEIPDETYKQVLGEVS